jgi:membrane protein DedA with SNARE-associated domain
MLDAFDALVRELGQWGVLLLGAAALLEYLFPPFPGDTITLLGGAYSARGDHPLWLVVLLLMAFSVVGMAVTWRFGAAIGHRLDAAKEGPLFLGVTHEQLRRAQDLMRRRGTWILLFNRFLPSFRALLFVAAGASGTPLSRVLLLGSVSALAWNGLLLAVGAAVGANAERLEAWLSRYRLIALGLVVVAALVALVVRFLRKPKT